MERQPGESRPLARAHEVVRDIDAVAREAMRRTGTAQATLIGWATGGMWAGCYAALWPERVGHLVMMNALYGGSDRHPMLGPGSQTEDPARRGRLHPRFGGFALYDAASLFPGWDNGIPETDKTLWRDPAIAEAYAAAALASDPRSGEHNPPAFRAPLGAMEDSFYQACGRRLFDAGSITARVLAIRSERDFWSRAEDADAFAQDAAHAREMRVVTLPGATHFVHLERAPRGRDALLREIAALFEA